MAVMASDFKQANVDNGQDETDFITDGPCNMNGKSIIKLAEVFRGTVRKQSHLSLLHCRYALVCAKWPITFV